MKFKKMIMYSLILLTNNYSMSDFFTNLKIFNCCFPAIATASEMRWNKQALKKKKDQRLTQYQDRLNTSRTMIITGLTLVNAKLNYDFYLKRKVAGGSVGGNIATGVLQLGICTAASTLGYSILSGEYYQEWKSLRTEKLKNE